MKFKNLQTIDKIMYALAMFLASITIIIISYFILLSVMSLFNSMEYYKILDNMNLYSGFYNILNVVNSTALITIFFAFIGIIPYLIISAIVFIFFTIRYFKYKNKKIHKALFSSIMLIIAVFSVIKGVSIYPITGRYELNINSKISEISNNEIKEFITEKMKVYNGVEYSSRILKDDYYIYNVKISSSFPDDYNGVVYYEDNGKKERKISIYDGDKIMKHTENRTNEYAIKATILFIAGEIAYVCFIIISQKEMKVIAKFKQNCNTDEKENRSKVKKVIVYTIISIFILTSIISIIIMLGYSKNENNNNTKPHSTIKNDNNYGYGSSSESSVSSVGILYETRINENTIIKVVNLGAILAQRSVVQIEKSTNGGKTFEGMTKEGITIHNGAEFCFINENVGFINDYGLAGTNGDNKFFKITMDGGRTFQFANIIHPDSIKEKNLLVKGVPYTENGKLKLQVYTLNHSKNPERTYYTFYSDDNGLNWSIEE